MQTVTKDYLALVTTFETTQTDDVRLEVVKEIADDLEVGARLATGLVALLFLWASGICRHHLTIDLQAIRLI